MFQNKHNTCKNSAAFISLELSAFQGLTATSSAGPWRTTEETSGLPSSGRTTFSASSADTR